MADVTTRVPAPSLGSNVNDNGEDWIGDHEQEHYEETTGITEKEFLRFYGAEAAGARSNDPKEGILFNDAADSPDTRTIKLRFLAWLATKKWKENDKDAAQKCKNHLTNLLSLADLY
jgi:hypothetical protein